MMELMHRFLRCGQYFPYYMYLLVNRHWISSAFFLSVIASSHNLSFLMTLSATVPYLISISLQRIKDLKKNMIKFFLTFFVFAIPALMFFYVPIITSVMTASSNDNPAGLSEPWAKSIVVEQIKPGLYYGGIICVFILVILNYRSFGWFAGWIAIYFVVFSLSSLLGARFGRELSVVYGIVIGLCIGHIFFVLVVCGRRWTKLFSSLTLKDARVSPTKLILAVIICASIVPLWYLYFHDRFQSNPLTVKYFSQNIDESNRLFMTPPNERHNSSDSFNDRGVIVLFGQNPWLKVSSFGKFEVLEPQIPALESTLGGADQKINHELNEIFLSSDIPSTACVIKKYDVDFIYVTAHSLPGRFYT